MRFIPDDVAVTRGLAAKQLSVPPHAVSMWIQRGWYDPDGNHHTAEPVGEFRGAKTYLMGVLRFAERCTRNSPNSSRNWRRGLDEETVAELTAA